MEIHLTLWHFMEYSTESTRNIVCVHTQLNFTLSNYFRIVWGDSGSSNMVSNARFVLRHSIGFSVLESPGVRMIQIQITLWTESQLIVKHNQLLGWLTSFIVFVSEALSQKILNALLQV